MKKLRIKLQKWVNGGYTIAHHDGHAVFINGGIPGELVDITLEKQGKKEWFGTVSEVIEASIDRIDSDCIVYQKCGGCAFRHITYKNEIEVKLQSLREMFPNESNWIELITGSELNYRNNVQWQIDKGKIGFFSKQTHQVVEGSQEACLNLEPNLLGSALNPIFKKNLGKKKSIHLRLTENGIIDYEKQTSLMIVKGFRIYVPEKGFFQVNRYLIQPWLDKIGEWLNEKEKVLELFCGSGMIGISLSKKIAELYGIELHSKSIDFAKENAKTNGVRNFHYESIDLYQRPIPKAADKYPTWIVNPPRAGLTKEIIAMMAQCKPTKIIYSSCNPSTLKRDIVELKKRNYRVSKIVLLDFFPRTPHYEVLTCLERT